MKVAVTYENGEVFQHFGRTPAFKVYEIADGVRYCLVSGDYLTWTPLKIMD